MSPRTSSIDISPPKTPKKTQTSQTPHITTMSTSTVKPRRKSTLKRVFCTLFCCYSPEQDESPSPSKNTQAGSLNKKLPIASEKKTLTVSSYPIQSESLVSEPQTSDRAQTHEQVQIIEEKGQSSEVDLQTTQNYESQEQGTKSNYDSQAAHSSDISAFQETSTTTGPENLAPSVPIKDRSSKVLDARVDPTSVDNDNPNSNIQLNSFNLHTNQLDKEVSTVATKDAQEEAPPRLSIDIGPDFVGEKDKILYGAPNTDDEEQAYIEVKAIVNALTKSEEDIVSDDLELRSEIASPRNNIASASSEKLVTRVSDGYLLDPLLPDHSGRKCLVLDLDETLVHSSFKPIQSPDYVVPVTLYGQNHDVYVAKRPNVDKFLLEASKHYELVVFTASLSMYADPVLDLLDTYGVITHRLFRESCSLYNMNYVKDLSRLGRSLADVIIIDNSPASYLFHPQNAISVTSWFNDPHDSELLDILPFLVSLSQVDDVAAVLNLNHNHSYNQNHKNNYLEHSLQPIKL